MLNRLFSAFDELVDRHGLEKIKTIGDAYMVAGGLPEPRPGHLEAMATFALDMLKAMQALPADQRELQVRIGHPRRAASSRVSSVGASLATTSGATR